MTKSGSSLYPTPRATRFSERVPRAAAVACLVAVAALLSPPQAMHAAPITDCNRAYLDCVDRASQSDSFFLRSAGGVICAYNYVVCLVRAANR